MKTKVQRPSLCELTDMILDEFFETTDGAEGICIEAAARAALRELKVLSVDRDPCPNYYLGVATLQEIAGLNNEAEKSLLRAIEMDPDGGSHLRGELARVRRNLASERWPRGGVDSGE